MADAFRMLSGYRVYCDESNTDGNKPHPIYGAILVALDHLPIVQGEINAWRRRESMHGELKWIKVRGGLRLKKYKTLIELLFKLARQRQLCNSKPSSSISGPQNMKRTARATTN